MLNSRQLLVMEDLEKATNPITAKALAEKYHVSLRTIRNDIDEIALEVKENGGTFIRIPHVGLRIASEEKISKKLSDQIQLSNFITLKSEERRIVLALIFLLLPSPLTLQKLEELLLISKKTIAKEIKQLNEKASEFKLEIKGQKNKGYFLLGKKTDIILFINDLLPLTDLTKIKKLIFSTNFFSEDEREEILNIYNYICISFSLTITDPNMLLLWLAIFIKQNRYQKPSISETDIKHSQKFSSDIIKKLSDYLTSEFSIYLSQETLDILKYFLICYTDYGDNSFSDKNKEDLISAIECMLDHAVFFRPELKQDYKNLKIDLLKHLTTSIERNQVNLPNNNPLINQIKGRYIDVFNIAKEAAHVFEQNFPMKLDENEIGFITLYFCRSLEKSQQIKDANVMVICNTGRGASKLLATRILNNIPNVHIKAMNSYLDIDQHDELLNHIDLIISTIPLSDINKPYVVVSPFLTELELEKIREAIWIGRQAHGTVFENDLNNMVNSMINQYSDSEKNDPNVFNGLLSASRYEGIPLFDEMAEFYADISVDIIEMMLKIFKRGLNAKQCRQFSGLQSHIFMSIPRWIKGEFIKTNKSDEVYKDYKNEYKIVIGFLNKLEKKLNIFISPSEAIAILRYIFY